MSVQMRLALSPEQSDRSAEETSRVRVPEAGGHSDASSTRNNDPLAPRKCESCPTWFTPENARVGAEQRNCSPKCRIAASKARRVGRPAFRRLGKLVCSWCYGPSDGEYCARECGDAAKAAPKKERSRRHEEARRRMGLATADENNRESREKAQALALRYLATHPVAIISDIRDFAIEEGVELEWHKPWTANVFRSPWFEFTGMRRAAHHTRSNARKVNEYRLTAAGRGALSELRSRS